MRTRLITLVSIIALTAFGAASASASAAASLPTRSSSAAAVTVAATPRALSGATWEFELTFTTHSGSLVDDIAKASTLVTDQGKTYTPVKWEGSPPGGHHRSGVLRFNPITPMPASIELRLSRAGEPQPRSFKWPLK